MQSTIRLFKALPVENHDGKSVINQEIMKETLARGFVLPGDVMNYYSVNKVIEEIDQVYGRSAEQLNAAFHKSFAKVRDASMQQLVMEQMIHYFTTYGFEALGIRDSSAVYIPHEQLDLPEITQDMRVVVIRGLTKEELKIELLQFLSTGVALSESTIKDVLDVATFVGVQEPDLKNVANKEVRAALYDYFGIVPSLPVEFLRFAVFRATDKTLLIKNAGTIKAIKENNGLAVSRLFDLYEEKYGLAPLAEIFYRYKPIFLAFRTNTKLKKTINKIRRLAKINHKPMQEDVLNSITARLAHREAPNLAKLNEALNTASVFRKARLAYALRFRTQENDSILFKVRNGKSFVKEFDFDNQSGAQIMYDVVIKAIVRDLEPQVKGKKIFIPVGLKYGLPATEKQFTGNLPSGTHVEVDRDMVAGVHWENVGRDRIDLDLSLQSADGKIGWDRSYRDSSNQIYFSGDMTDASKPNGATEVFHIGAVARGAWLMNLNYFNFDDRVPVPFRIVVAREDRGSVEKNYVLDPNKIIAQSYSEISERQKIIGIIVANENSTKFFFSETNFGNAISSRVSKHTEQARKFMLNFFTDTIVLNDLLEMAGAEVFSDPLFIDQENVIDLSPEVVDKTTIINLLTGDQN